MGAPSGKWAIVSDLAKQYDADIREDAIRQLMTEPLDELTKQWNKMKKAAISKALWK